MIKTKKVLGLFLICAMLFSFSFSALAAEESKVYTLDYLTEKALQNNPAIWGAKAQIESVEIIRDRANINLSFIPVASIIMYPDQHTMAYKQAIALNRNYETAKDKLQIEIDSIRYETIKRYQTLLSAQNDFQFALKDLEQKRNQMDTSKLKMNLGLVSELENTSLIKVYNIAKTDFELKKQEVEKAFADLNTAAGINLSDRYAIQIPEIAQIDMEMKDSDMEKFISMAKDGLLVRILERNLDQSQFSYDFYIYNDPTEPRPLDAIGKDIESETASLASTKNTLADSIRAIFQNARQVQKNYNDLLIKDELDQKNHAIKKIQFDLGMLTKTELDQSELRLLENQNNLQALKSAFNELIFMLNYPHVAAR